MICILLNVSNYIIILPISFTVVIFYVKHALYYSAVQCCVCVHYMYSRLQAILPESLQSLYKFVSIGYLSLYVPDMKVLPLRDLDYQPTYISQFHLHSINFYMNYEIAIGVGVLIHIYMFY